VIILSALIFILIFNRAKFEAKLPFSVAVLAAGMWHGPCTADSVEVLVAAAALEELKLRTEEVEREKKARKEAEKDLQSIASERQRLQRARDELARSLLVRSHGLTNRWAQP
jgi:hypothetical protein